MAAASSALLTARLRLRPLQAADVTTAYVGWLNDPEVVRYLETRHAPQTLQTVAAYVERTAGRPEEPFLAILLRDDDRHIGNIKLGPVHPIHRVGDVSLVIGDRSAWGRGYATEAISALAQHAFENLGVLKLAAGLYAENVASERAFLKAGFVREGVRRAHYDLEGVRADIVELGLTREDWVAARSS